MRALVDFTAAPAYSVPSTDAGIPGVSGLLLEGPQGWGEFSPRGDADAAAAVVAAIEPGTVGWPDPVRGWAPVALTIPVGAAQRAAGRIADSGCRTVRLPVTGRAELAAAESAAIRSVRAALGADGGLRLVLAADSADPGPGLAALTESAGGVEFIELGHGSAHRAVELRRSTGAPIAAHLTGAEWAELARSLDVVVLSVAALGGARRCLRIAEQIGKPVVVASAGESSIGLSAGLALAGALPELPYACALGDLGWLAGDLVESARQLRPRAGRLPVAPMPPAPDPAMLERFAITDATELARWRERLRRVS
ncbi:enolase C-terminal domain-like protein [Mycolicibacterium brumae]|uniref:enolase C-terminal domain-like protein n=1 Tax=Mycolicibacterium brumae TaxID=85968 RepID=UPI001F4584E6|nr:enolase C-terminal domain-like protein [Mycolicibacterium brumae]UWW08671.1 O-succinylbenzoate synthase [Mycolicibacterium brumae]